MQDLLKNLVKYLLEGMAVASAVALIPRRPVALKEIVLIALTSAAVFAILDQVTPEIGQNARKGAGFGLGFNLTGFNPVEFVGGQGTNLTKASCTCDVDLDYLKRQLANSQMSDMSSVNLATQAQAPDATTVVSFNASGTPVAMTRLNNSNLPAANSNLSVNMGVVEGFDSFKKNRFNR